MDRFFRGGEPRDDAVLVAVNWHDNPWFSEVLDQEKESDYASDPEMADRVWGGNYEIVSEASYSACLIVVRALLDAGPSRLRRYARRQSDTLGVFAGPPVERSGRRMRNLRRSPSAT